MGKDNFYKLCGELRPFIQRKVTNMARWRGLFYSFLDSFMSAWERDRHYVNGYIGSV